MDDISLFNQKRKVIVTIFCLFAIFQSGLREIDDPYRDGDDTPNYQNMYKEIDEITWSTLCEKFSFYSSEYEEREGGYSFFVKATQLVYNDFRFFMFLSAAILIIPIGMIIYKYVESYEGLFLSFLIYFALFGSLVNGLMRQAVVLGVILFSLRYVKTQNWKKYFATLALLFTIHTSAIIAIPFYFMPRYFSSRRWVLIALVAAPFLTMSVGFLISRLLAGTVYDAYIDSDNLGLVNLLLLISFISLLVYLHYDKIEQVEDYEYLICGVIGTLACMPFIRMGGALLRVSYYYFLFFIPLIPVVIDRICSDRFVYRMSYLFSICFFLFLLLH